MVVQDLGLRDENNFHPVLWNYELKIMILEVIQEIIFFFKSCHVTS